jgi:membrane-associated phospholipid phosphatase
MSGGRPFLGWPGWRHCGLAGVLFLAGTVWFILIYGGADAITAAHAVRVRVHFDAELGIPFVPAAVLLYMSVYPLFALAPFVLRDRREILALSLTQNTLILVAGVVFLCLPAELAFPLPSELGAFPELFRLADRLNLDFNLLPSLHVALSTSCVLAYRPHANPTVRWMLMAWAAAIALSTLLTHQHHVADVLAGGLLAWLGQRFVFVRVVARF